MASHLACLCCGAVNIVTNHGLESLVSVPDDSGHLRLFGAFGGRRGAERGSAGSLLHLRAEAAAALPRSEHPVPAPAPLRGISICHRRTAEPADVLKTGCLGCALLKKKRKEKQSR